MIPYDTDDMYHYSVTVLHYSITIVLQYYTIAMLQCYNTKKIYKIIRYALVYRSVYRRISLGTLVSYQIEPTSKYWYGKVLHIFMWTNILKFP